ncbi:MAG: hypothetical protein RL662_1269 [Bacteroidota bacterium]|jgi:hypothetical protein
MSISQKIKPFIVLYAIILTFCFVGVYVILPGSYSQAQYYDLEIPENKIRERVTNFKEIQSTISIYEKGYTRSAL